MFLHIYEAVCLFGSVFVFLSATCMKSLVTLGIHTLSLSIYLCIFLSLIFFSVSLYFSLCFREFVQLSMCPFFCLSLSICWVCSLFLSLSLLYLYLSLYFSLSLLHTQTVAFLSVSLVNLFHLISVASFSFCHFFISLSWFSLNLSLSLSLCCISLSCISLSVQFLLNLRSKENDFFEAGQPTKSLCKCCNYGCLENCIFQYFSREINFLDVFSGFCEKRNLHCR